jgi:cyclic beta-1,2-glucan synthetase
MKVNDLVRSVTTRQRMLKNADEVVLCVGRPGVQGFEQVAGLEQKAAQLSASHRVSNNRPTPGRLLVPFMMEQVRQLLAAYQQCVTAQHEHARLSPAAQYLVENFAPLEKHLREISANLKAGYDDGLPKLEAGPLAGYPRIYAIARSIVRDTDACLDAEMLEQYFRTYQRTAPLSIGELLAVRAMLRLALVENLSQIATRMIQAHEEQVRFDGLVPSAPDRLAQVLTGERGRATELTVEASFRSLRWLATFDAHEFFESVSLVEFILRQDPSGTYSLMEPVTRESYRRAVRNIARKAGLAEPTVAQKAIELAREAFTSRPSDERRAHVGHHLIDEGLIALELRLEYKPARRERWSRALKGSPTFFYLGVQAFLSTIIVVLFISYAAHLGTSVLTLAWLAVLVVVPVSDFVLSALNAVLRFQPALLPKMDFSHGIPAEAQTMVVVPAIISSETVVQELLETIEAHYLSNQDGQLFFALLTDWSDAAQESVPGDAALLHAALLGIEKLNERHADRTSGRFFLFHRRRRWNPSEGKWIGWERKRGKLHEFNQLLRGAPETSYIGVTTDSDFLARVRYVITLDSDTLLPRDAARRLIGTISHPLNRPQLDLRTGRVVQGYGIIQPHVTVLPPGAPRSSIPGILSNRFNVNAHSQAPSNVYQDLFGDCNYVGKGLYEVDVFEAALENRIPENSLLSHDLFEGLYARPAFAADIKLFDSPQSNYEAVAKRQHRWTRGDWQLWPWLLPRVPVEHGTAARNVLPVVARWKILDNLRRSLVQPFLLLWLLASWTILPGSPLTWTLLVILTIFAKLAFAVAPNFSVGLRQAPPARLTRYIVSSVTKQCAALVMQLLIAIAYLAHQSYLMLDAIARTLYRGVISGKRLLEWRTAAQVLREAALSLSATVRYMLAALIIAAGCGVLVLSVSREAFWIAAPFLLAWFISPFLVYYLNHRLRIRSLGFEVVVERMLRLSGRRMWQTLESFLGIVYDSRSFKNDRNQSSYIAPLRSSPVNLSRLLLWTRTAYELGSIGTTELAGRLELTLAEMKKLHRFRSELQEPQTAAITGPLAPTFILQAENGNLAGHLHTFEQFYSEIGEQPLFDERVFKGLADTISLMTDGLKRTGITSPATGEVILTQLGEELNLCAWFLHPLNQAEAPRTHTAWRRIFNTLVQRAAIFEVTLHSLSRKYPATNVAELGSWTNALTYQVRGFASDLQLYAPWTSEGFATLAPLIRKYEPTAVVHWNRIIEMLDHVPAISQLPETLAVVRSKLTRLVNQMDQVLPANTIDRTNILDGCARLERTIDAASRAANDMHSRYADLASRSAALMDTTDLSFLFDEERKVLRNRFPNKLR